MRYSIVIPCHNEEGNVPVVYAAIVEATRELPGWELIFVDDGSADGTAAAIQALRHHDRRVKLVRLARNYGQQKALMAGLRQCSRDFTITMDADLQHPASCIPLLVARYLAE